MHDLFFLDQKFDKDFVPLKGEYEHCTFVGCNLAEVDLSGYKFNECSFVEVNLSLAKLQRTALRAVRFKDCKMLGLRFDTCHTLGFSVSFESCQLQHSSFFKLKMKQTLFKDSNLHECDFTETDLSSAVFDHANLELATFNHTLLEKADFRTAYNFSIDPQLNRLTKARFSLAGLTGLLRNYNLEIEA